MQDSQDNSLPNPFRQLNISDFPVQKKHAAKKHRVVTETVNDDEDSRLFMQATENLVQQMRKPKSSGFKMAEQIQMPEISPKKMKKKNNIEPPAEEIENSEPIEPVKNIDRDAEEFLSAVGNAQPLQGNGRRVAAHVAKNTYSRANDASFEEMLAGKLKFYLHYSDEYLEGKVSGLDEMIMCRLREGQMSPEAHLDLHGLNAMQAWESLRVFVRDSWFKGLRVILLVPGRGKNSPAGMGILRKKLQEWLTQDPFKRVVLAFCTAMPHDGGPGSIYVLLRKFRKKGHIYWDRLPADADLYPN